MANESVRKDEKRKFLGIISVRFGTKLHKIELSPAELHGGEPGLFRARVGRRWHDAPDGELIFLGRDELAALAAALALGELPTLEPLPNIPRGSYVAVKFWHDDMPCGESTYTATPPVRLADGRAHVGVMTYEAGFIFVPIGDVRVLRLKRRRQYASRLQDERHEKES